MIIKKGNKLYSIEGVKKVVIFSFSSKNKLHLHIRSKILNSIKLPISPENYNNEKIINLACLYTSPKRKMDAHKINLLWYHLPSYFINGDFIINNGDFETMKDSNFEILSREIQIARRYTPPLQYEEIKGVFNIIWETNCLTLIKTKDIIKIEPEKFVIIVPYKGFSMHDNLKDSLKICFPYTPIEVLLREEGGKYALLSKENTLEERLGLLES